MCIGTDRVVGDSLGPKVGEKLIKRDIQAFIYGRTGQTVNGDNIGEYYKFIRKKHKGSAVIAVDACLGKADEVGKVMYSMSGIGAGFAIRGGGKRYGDIGIVGVMAPSGGDNIGALMMVDADAAERVAEKIAEYIIGNLWEILLKVKVKKAK